MELAELKKNYEVLRKKHSLPDFDVINNDFDIGKIDVDSGNLIKDVRRMIMEKVVHYIRLAELMFNPSQASPVFMIMLKEVTSEDKKTIDLVLKSLVDLELKSYKLDLEYSEKTEADFIKEVNNVWNKNRALMLRLLNILYRNWNAINSKKEKGYFG